MTEKILLQDWIREQTVGDEMRWKGAWGHQVAFVRDDLRYVVAAGLDHESARGLVTVISTHTSKSILLPVYDLARPDLGLRLILRNNFHNWKLSVLSDEPIIANFDGLFHTTSPVEPDYTGNPLAPVYFEGFPKDLIFGYFGESDGRRWSAELWGGDHALWCAVFTIMRARGAIRSFKWNTKESHAAELKRDRERREAQCNERVPS